MKDTLERMLEAEKEAGQIVSDADNEARKAVDEAHRRASDIVNEAREASHREAKKIVDEAVDAARKEKAHRLAEVSHKLESLPRQVPAERKREAAELVVKAVLMQG